MANNSNTLASPEDILVLIKSKISKETSLAFLSAVIIGLIVHLYFFMNNLPHADSLIARTYHPGHAWDIATGRWAWQFLDNLDTYFTLPWVTGMICLFSIGLVSALLVRLFNLQQKFDILLLSAVVVTFPAVTIAFCQIQVVNCFMISYFLSVFAVYCLVQFKKTGILLSSVSIALSLANYQAYIGVTILLYNILLIQELLRGTELKKLLCKGLRYLLSGVIGVTLYFISFKVSLELSHLTLPDWRGINTIGQIKLSEIPSLILQTYQYFFNYVFTDQIHYNPWCLVVLYAVICTTILGFILFEIITKKIYRHKADFIVLFMLLLLLPFSVAIWRFLAPRTPMSISMIPQYSLFLFLPIVLSEIKPSDEVKSANDNNNRKRALKSANGGKTKGLNQRMVLKWASVVACCLISYHYYLLDNIAYQNLNLQYQKTYAVAVRIVDRIEQQPNYSNQTKLAVLGGLPSANYPITNEPQAKELKGLDLPAMNNFVYMDSSYSWYSLFYDYLGVSFIGSADQNEQNQIKATNEFKGMGCFPAANSVKIINGFTVVKLS